MDLRGIVLNYLTDNEKGMQQLINGSERCDKRGGGLAGRSTATREIGFEKGLLEWLPVHISQDPVG